MTANTRIFLTGRPHVQDEIIKWFGKVITIPLSPTNGDIVSYLEMKLDRDTDPDVMDGDLRADIMGVVPGEISEV